MCGIFFLNFQNSIDFNNEFWKIKHRGPDSTCIHKYDNCIFGFHRLMINDITLAGMQPFENDEFIMIINGEIYNHLDLISKYAFRMKSNSDCEVLIHMYKKFGYQFLDEVKGVFAVVIYDKINKEIFAARDPFGVRSMFIGQKSNGKIGFASEMKSLIKYFDDIKQFHPGTYMIYSKTQNYTKRYYNLQLNINDNPCKKEDIRNILCNSVFKRINNTNVPVGFLLSGGLDSSIVCAIASRFNSGIKPIRTFSVAIGKESNDVKYIDEVVQHIKSDHTHIEFSEIEAFNIIPEVIYALETYDITTIRASVPMFLLCKWIKDNTNIGVLLSGEGADEIAGGYLYHHNAPSLVDYNNECFRLLDNIHYYDVLRADKVVSANSIELRVPFLDTEFAQNYLSLDVFKRNNKEIEKKILRELFEKWLPSSVIWRKKDAFSDSVGHTWRDYIIKKLKDESTNEKDYYLNIFKLNYGNRFNIIPDYWMPKWVEGITDPSARELKKVNN